MIHAENESIVVGYYDHDGLIDCTAPVTGPHTLHALATKSGNGILATKSGDDFGICHSGRLISLFQNHRPAVDLIGVGSTCMCDAAGYHTYVHGIASSARTKYGVAGM